MTHKEYPMDEDYNRALTFLTEQIAERDSLRERLKLLPPAARPEALRLLADLDKAIEKGEQALAEEYEAYQTHRRAEEERDKKFDKVMETMAGAYIHAKYRNPEMIDGLEEIINNMPPEQAEDFYARAARHEAGDLISLISRQGETREQTEEFLKNYRAAQNKQI